MPVTNVIKDAENLQLTLVAEFDAPVERVWQVFEDPRQLERWWGPPTWPATFTEHEFTVGSMSKYHMTGPDGTKAAGWWIITSINEHSQFTFDDGFADSNGEPVDPDDKTSAVVSFETTAAGTQLTLQSTFRSAEQMEKMINMGMAEGITLAMGQIDDILGS